MNMQHYARCRPFIHALDCSKHQSTGKFSMKKWLRNLNFKQIRLQNVGNAFQHMICFLSDTVVKEKLWECTVTGSKVHMIVLKLFGLTCLYIIYIYIYNYYIYIYYSIYIDIYIYI